METKICKKCGQSKPLSDFDVSIWREKEYRNNICRECHNTLTKERHRKKMEDPEYRKLRAEKQRERRSIMRRKLIAFPDTNEQNNRESTRISEDVLIKRLQEAKTLPEVESAQRELSMHVAHKEFNDTYQHRGCNGFTLWEINGNMPRIEVIGNNNINI